LCTYAAVNKDFWLLCAATVIAGYYNANAGLYRFAAAELVTPDWREKAVSMVLAGGLIGAVLGPNLAAQTRTLFSVPFAGAYLTLAVVALLAIVLMSFIQFPPPPVKTAASSGGRPLSVIMRQPVFIVAAAAGALGYGVMNLLMAATPLAMQQCQLPFSDVALVLEWHVIGMFAPGFFTGHLIKRFGVLPIMGVGVVLNALCIAIALTGVDLHQFLAALFLLGVGWNFLFTGSTTLSLQTYTPEEKDRAQGALNFFVFATLAYWSRWRSVGLRCTNGDCWVAARPRVQQACGVVEASSRKPQRHHTRDDGSGADGAPGRECLFQHQGADQGRKQHRCFTQRCDGRDGRLCHRPQGDAVRAH
jgi:predicted MFS family arabinose efflux permease